MKRTLIIILIFINGNITSFGQESDSYLKELITKNQCFKLQQEYPALEKQASKQMQLFAKAHLNSYFNKPEQAIEEIKLLLSDYPSWLDDCKLNLAILMAGEYEKMQNYQYATSIYQQLFMQLQPSAATADWIASTVRMLKDQYRFSNVLKNVSPLEVNYLGEKSTIYLSKDTMGYYLLPVNNLDFVMDFGAPFCMVEEKYATDLGIEILADSINIDFTNKKGKEVPFSKIGIAKEISMGTVKLKNVVFVITPNKILRGFEEHYPNYEMKGIIGLSVLQAFKNLTISDIKLTIAKKENSAKHLPNMALVSGVLFLQIVADEDSLTMLFDSGAKESLLLETYLTKTNEDVGKLSKDSVLKGAYYGSERLAVYTKQNFHFKFGTKDFVIPSIKILPNQGFGSYEFDGIIGKDILSKNKETVIDFKNMTIEFH